jgi:hypothetical protein
MQKPSVVVHAIRRTVELYANQSYEDDMINFRGRVLGFFQYLVSIQARHLEPWLDAIAINPSFAASIINGLFDPDDRLSKSLLLSA